MMKLSKKIGVVAASAALATMMATPAFATSIQSPHDAASTITGTIKPTTISVTVPTAASFDLDPFATFADVNSQLKYPLFANGNTEKDPPANDGESQYRIINRTLNVPVYAAMTNVAVVEDIVGPTLDSKPTKVKLINDTSNVGTKGYDSGDQMVTDAAQTERYENSILFSVKKQGVTPTEGETSHWLTPGLPTAEAPVFLDIAGVPTQGELATAGKLEAATEHIDADDGTTKYTYGGILPMGFFGKAVADPAWIAGQSFTVTPTFTIKTEPFTHTGVTP